MLAIRLVWPDPADPLSQVRTGEGAIAQLGAHATFTVGRPLPGTMDVASDSVGTAHRRGP